MKLPTPGEAQLNQRGKNSLDWYKRVSTQHMSVNRGNDCAFVFQSEEGL